MVMVITMTTMVRRFTRVAIQCQPFSQLNTDELSKNGYEKNKKFYLLWAGSVTVQLDRLVKLNHHKRYKR